MLHSVKKDTDKSLLKDEYAVVIQKIEEKINFYDDSFFNKEKAIESSISLLIDAQENNVSPIDIVNGDIDSFVLNMAMKFQKLPLFTFIMKKIFTASFIATILSLLILLYNLLPIENFLGYYFTYYVNLFFIYTTSIISVILCVTLDYFVGKIKKHSLQKKLINYSPLIKIGIIAIIFTLMSIFAYHVGINWVGRVLNVTIVCALIFIIYIMVYLITKQGGIDAVIMKLKSGQYDDITQKRIGLYYQNEFNKEHLKTGISLENYKDQTIKEINGITKISLYFIPLVILEFLFSFFFLVFVSYYGLILICCIFSIPIIWLLSCIAASKKAHIQILGEIK